MGPWEPPSISQSREAPKGSGSMGISVGIVGLGCTQGWWVLGNLHWCHQVGMYPKVLGPWAPPSTSPNRDAPKGDGCQGTSISITKWGCTQGCWVPWHLHHCPQAEIDTWVVGPWPPPPVSPLGLTLGAHGLRGAAGVAEPVSVDRPDQEEVDGVGDKAAHRVAVTLHVSRHRLPRATRRLAVGRQE